MCNVVDHTCSAVWKEEGIAGCVSMQVFIYLLCFRSLTVLVKLNLTSTEHTSTSDAE